MLVGADIALMWRAVCEEQTLSRDAAYREYLQTVRWRVVPGALLNRVNSQLPTPNTQTLDQQRWARPLQPAGSLNLHPVVRVDRLGNWSWRLGVEPAAPPSHPRCDSAGVPELLHQQDASPELACDDAALHALAAAVNQPHFLQPPFMCGADVLLDN
jgi:hypothetical protein